MKTPKDWLEYQIKELGLTWKKVQGGVKVLTDKDGNHLGLHLCKLDGTLPKTAICPGWALYEFKNCDGLNIFYESGLET